MGARNLRSDPCALTDSLHTRMASARPRIPSIRTLTATDLLDEVLGDIDMFQPLETIEHQQCRDELEDDPSNSRFRTGWSCGRRRLGQRRLGVHVEGHREIVKGPVSL